MSERMLAHVEKVIDVQPIEGADKIEVATVLGWQCVVKKNEVNVGDLVVYIEIDSVLPDIPYFQFMEPRKYRVKTIKLRKQISQGLIIPISDISKIAIDLESINDINILKEGQDITGLLNITKYESPSDRESNNSHFTKRKYSWYIKWLTRYQWFRKLTGMRSKSFPDWLKKIDETRLQNIPSILRNTDKDWYATEKVDGQSGRIGINIIG